MWDLGQQEVLQLLLLVRQQNHSTVSVNHSDVLHTDVELQLDGPETHNIDDKATESIRKEKPERKYVDKLYKTLNA